MKVGEYLFNRLRDAGVGHVFGVPGDFVLPHFRAAEEAGLSIVTTTHEPAAGFAADAYARLRGLGVALATYGAGALNMVNSIAQAYAEESPVVVVGGAPEIRGRRDDALFHHRVKSFESQLNVYREITGAAVAVDDPLTAVEDVDRVLGAVQRTKRPGYVEVPRDVLGATLPDLPRPEPELPERDLAALDEAMAEVVGRLERSEHPVIWAGVETERFGLRSRLIALVEKLGAPVVTSIEGKCVFPEDHPSFAGLYLGRAGSEAAWRLVESADCVLMLGAYFTDVSTGFYSAHVDRSRVIAATAADLSVGHHRYPDITLADLMDYLLATPLRRWTYQPEPCPPPAEPRADGRLLTAQVVDELNAFVGSGQYVVVSDTGDCLYASVDLRAELFLGPGYYNSMGFGVPAAIAVPLARPDRRAIVLVGDGGFQMTGLELATARRLGQNPIVVLFDNAGYAMMRTIAGERPYFDIPAWDYVAIARALGGQGIRVQTREELRAALRQARLGAEFCLIDAVLDPSDVSPTWRRITEGVRARTRAAAG